MQMNKRKTIFYTSIILIFISPGIISANQLADKIERLKPTVVNLEISSEVNLGFDTAGQWHATGFIVDAKHGFIATNRHVTSTSPVSIKITFIDGSSTNGKVHYYDYYHDFALIKFDPSSVRLKLQEAPLGSSFNLKPQQTLFLIGNNEREEYSVKIGMVVNLRANKGDRHSMTIHTSFDRTGGSSGSPVFNEQGQVIGMHFSGTNTSSFELPIEYIIDSLDAIRKSKIPQRGDVGLQLDYVNVDDAIKHIGISKDYRQLYKREFPRATKFIHVRRVLPNSPAESVVKPGDIVWAVGDQHVGENLYLFDKLVDQSLGQTIQLILLEREGKKVLQLPVQDLEKQKTKRFVLFGGGTFQNITTEFRRMMDYGGDGVFMNHVRAGSAFASLGVYEKDEPATRRVVIRELNGKQIRSLDDFIRAGKQLRDGTHTTVIYQDFESYNTSPKVTYTSFYLKFSPFRIVQINGERKVVKTVK